VVSAPNQDRRDDACTMIANIYNWFTEGFDTADFKDARALLEELRAQRHLCVPRPDESSVTTKATALTSWSEEGTGTEMARKR